MPIARKNGAKTEDTRFKPGNPGRPPGARHKTTLAIEAMMDGEAEAISRKAIQLALEGDLTAIKLVLDRIAPPRKGRPTPLALPAVNTAQGVHAAVIQVIGAVAGGDLTTEEGASVIGLLDAARVSLQAMDMEARLRALEEHNAQR